jgi:hypothetical protein
MNHRELSVYALVRGLELSARRSRQWHTLPGELAPSRSSRWWRLEEIADVQLLVLALNSAQHDRRSAVPSTDLEQVPSNTVARLYLAEPEEQRRIETIEEARHVLAPLDEVCRRAAQLASRRRIAQGLISRTGQRG